MPRTGSPERVSQQIERYKSVLENEKVDSSPESYLRHMNAANRVRILEDTTKLGAVGEAMEKLQSRDTGLDATIKQNSAFAMAGNKGEELGNALLALAPIGSVAGMMGGLAYTMQSAYAGGVGAPVLGGLALGTLAATVPAIATKLRQGVLRSVGYDKVLDQLHDPARMATDLSRESMAFARGECWVVNHPGLDEPAILTQKQYTQYKKDMAKTNIPLIEIDAGVLNIKMRRTVGGKLQSEPDFPAVLTFSRSGRDKTIDRDFWFDEGRRVDASFFQTSHLVDTPFMRASQRVSDGQVSIDVLAPGASGLERTVRTYRGDEAQALLERLSLSDSPLDREAVLAEHLGVPAPSQWLDHYDPARGEAVIENGAHRIGISPASGGAPGWEMSVTDGPASSSRANSLRCLNTDQLRGFVQQVVPQDRQFDLKDEEPRLAM